MPQRLEVHRVFLASPSDVMDERAAALAVVNALNTTVLQPQGRLLHLTGWEYLAPGAGRPQTIINHLVDECDIFVGLLHERWGTPTGQWSSGFEEEFQRADSRRTRTGHPNMAMFFKAPTDATRQAPTEDYQRVQTFRASIGQHHLYDVVRTTEEWRYKLSHFLTAAMSLGVDSPSTPEESTDGRRVLRDAITRLPDIDQTVLGLHFFEGMTTAQIADILGLTAQAAGGLLDGALYRLRDHVEQMGLDPADLLRGRT